MADYRYERLSALDNMFLQFEDTDTPMHVAFTGIFEAGSLADAQGAIDMERLSAHIESRLHRIPRYRERLAYIPIENHPVWVDDGQFNLHYHLRHTSLPQLADERQLKRLSGRIMSQQLDRRKPLWEMWVVEGLPGRRFALIAKMHHCMVDGLSGVDLVSVLMNPMPEKTVAPARRWIPRPAPTPAELLRDELLERVRAPLGLATRIARQPGEAWKELRDGTAAVAQAVRSTLRLASRTPLNQAVGSHRRFDWTTMDLGAVRAIGACLGGTVNDVVLAVVTDAVRYFLKQRGVALRDLRFRVFVPVSMRSDSERGTLGNRVAGWVVDLPLAEKDLRTCYTTICKQTAALRASGQQARGTEILTRLADWSPTNLATVALRVASQSTTFNMVVTNVPGPASPLYLLDAQLTAAYPMVPLFVNQCLGVALFSNDDKLFWGFNADWDAIPDLHDFVTAIDVGFEKLLALAGVRKASEKGRPSRAAVAEQSATPAAARARAARPKPAYGGNGNVATP